MNTPTDDQLVTLARDHYAAHPDATPLGVLAVARAIDWAVQEFQVFNACEAVRPIPALTSVTDAVEFMTALHRIHGDVGVFWDRGWGDDRQKTEITVIVDGDGQIPLARIDPDVYRDLVKDELIGENTYGGFKARRFHDFLPTVVV
jgi:hypothetical protein